MYEQFVLFPERAEYLAQPRFDSYRVSLEHWTPLATTFRSAFEAVYERQSARVLLVHGAQGVGKSLFVRRIQDDFDASRTRREHDPENLWHLLAGGSPFRSDTLAKAVDTSEVRRVEASTGWLGREATFASADRHAIRIFLFDDAHKDAFIREWAGLTQGEYLTMKAAGQRAVVLESVAQRIVEDCRGQFSRSVFVLLSNDAEFLDHLRSELDKSHAGLAERIELPLPAADIKEKIVRTNTNILNPRSYWYCLDRGGPEEKKDAWHTLVGEKGFIDAFQAINRALTAQDREKRRGRPANKNVLTLVTLGTPPTDVASFVSDRELIPDESDVQADLGVWWFRDRWASSLQVEGQADLARRASLVESEFSLRWVALSMRATWALCSAPDGDASAAAVVEVLKTTPSIGDSKTVKGKNADAIRAAADALEAAPSAAVAAFAEEFTAKGQLRSRDYEPAIAHRMAQQYGVGLDARGSLRPDVILHEYEPCAVTRAPDDKAIETAIRRSCHVVEITAHLRADLEGLDAYLRDKVRAYAELLESV